MPATILIDPTCKSRAIRHLTAIGARGVDTLPVPLYYGSQI